MSERSGLVWEVVSLAGLREAGRLRDLGRALDSEPDLAYTHGGRSFPPRRRLKGGVADLLASYEGRLDPKQPEIWFFARDQPPEASLDIYLADDGRLLRDMPHRINAGFSDRKWFDTPGRLRMLADYLARVADEARAFYAYCTQSDLLDQRLRLLQRNAGPIFGALLKAGRAAEDLHRELPDVFWWNYFGPAFVEKWNGRMDGIGVRQERTPTGARVIWATETPFVLDPHMKRLADYPWKKQFYAALGDDTFMREGQKQQAIGEVVPDFDAHRRAAGAVAVDGGRGADVRSRILPRVARLRELPPEEAVLTEAGARLIEDQALVLHLLANKAVSLDEIARGLGRRKNITIPTSLDVGRLIVYRNPDTAVVAGFEVEDPAGLAGRLPAKIRSVGLRFRLPWRRPSFFAQEAMPLLVELAERVGLMVAPAHLGSNALKAQAATLSELVNLWHAGNEQAVRRQAQVPLPRMNPERSERWWLYQSRKQELHRRMGDGVFVPTLVAVAPGRRTDDLQLHITWTDGIPLLLPQCDLVTLLDGTRPSEFKIRGTAAYAAVRTALEPFLDSIDVEGLGAVPLLTPKRAKEVRSVYLNLPTRAVDHVEIDPAGWVDVSRGARAR